MVSRFFQTLGGQMPSTLQNTSHWWRNPPKDISNSYAIFYTIYWQYKEPEVWTIKASKRGIKLKVISQKETQNKTMIQSIFIQGEVSTYFLIHCQTGSQQLKSCSKNVK